MKISIKNIKGEIYLINAEESDRIHDLKVKINALKGIDIETQKLIYKGQVTLDEKTLGSYSIKENDVLVLMISKKPQNNPELPKKEELKQNEPLPVPNPNINKPIAHPQQVPGQNQNPNSLVMGEEYNKTVDEIVKMGFAKDDVIKALNAAYNNPDRAIDYLINGVPNIPLQQEPNPNYSQPAQNQPLPGGPGINANDPLLEQLRNSLRNDPSALQNMLSNLATTNPQLFQIIQNNPEEFMRLLEEGDLGDDAMDEEDEEEGVPIDLTEEDNQAIDRLCALGFNKEEVIEAFLICEKNEELTANYLFDNH